MTPNQSKNFKRLLNPKHIAFVGGRDAAIAVAEAQRIGFEGQIWPVNPKRENMGGVKCYRSVEDLPETPDAAFVAVPVPQAIETIAKLRDKGTGGIVCYTAGFRETGEGGIAAETALVEAAGEMALIGPNCYGMINYLTKAALWPFAQGGSTPGYGCAIITQSGMLSSDMTMSQRSVPLTHMISVGNQSVITIEDLIDELCDDERVRAIGVHIEGIRDVGKFADAALKATRLGKPVVALKTGSSTIGRALTSSHTGSLSGEDDLYNALFDRVGVIRVFSPAQMLETLKLMSVAGAPKGNRLIGFTCSGGGATMLADHAEKVELEYPAFSKASSDKLTELLPSIATVSNPLDYTTPIWGQPEYTGPVFSQAMADGFDAAILVQDYPAVGSDEFKSYYSADAAAFADATREAGIPAIICSTLPENIDEESRELLISRGVAPMQGLNEALDAFSALVSWGKIRKRILSAAPLPVHAVNQCDPLTAIDESEAKRMLATGGVAVPESETCNGEEAADVAERLGFPVVLKMVHRDLLHKTEAGAVKVNLKTRDEVIQAVSEMHESVNQHQPEACCDVFLVEKMQEIPIAELIVSIRQDHQFGLAMTIGSGGVLVELLEDAVTLLLPCTNDDTIHAINKLKASRLMAGFRKRPAVNLDNLIRCIGRIGAFAEANIGKVAEVEINPLFVYEDTSCAVDVLIHVSEQTES